MKVKDFMNKQVYTVDPNDMVDRVFFLIHHEKIRHLPVVQKQRVVGIVSDRDLYKALGPRGRRPPAIKEKDDTILYVSPKRVHQIMHRGVIWVEPEEGASRAAMIMAKKKIGALPVMHQGKLVGIITATDILLAFARLMKENGGSRKTQLVSSPP